MKAGDSVPAAACNEAGEKKRPVRNAICNNKPYTRETRHIISLIVYIRKQDKPLITGASFHYKVRLRSSLCAPSHTTRHDTTRRSLFHRASASCGYSSVTENVPYRQALKQMDGNIVGCKIMLQRFLSVKLCEELLMSTELDTTGDKTATVKFEGLSPVISFCI
jgi:hypothetical protein